MHGEVSPGAAYTLARAVLRPVLRASAGRQWQGQEYIPGSGGFVVVANHLSHSDPIPISDFIDSAGRRPRFLGKAELFDVPVMGSLLHSAGQIPVQRESAQAGAALAAAVAAVRAGHCVVIYPEGTLTRDAELWPMVGKTGAARVWWETRCPVVPVAQWGPQEILRPYGRRPKLLPPTTVHVLAGPPVDLSAYDGLPLDAVTLKAATDTILDAVADLLGRLRGRTPPEHRWDPREHDQPRIGDPTRGVRDSTQDSTQEREAG